jgi:molybdopterin converting factor small subunit
MQTWLSIDEFSKLIGKSTDEIKTLCKKEKLNCKKEENTIYIEAQTGTKSLIPITTNIEVVEDNQGSVLEKTISTILTLHEKILEAKDETINTMKNENEFLKNSIISMQEIYDEDRKTIESLQKQLKICQEELEFCRKKYKLMWGKVINKRNDSEDE